ncbi:hypothetical protein TWF281_006675 [Arthrobotrys megalospora]
MATTCSLQQFLDKAELPTLVLDFRSLQYLDEPSKATISDVVVSRNGACHFPKFKGSVETLLSQRLSNGKLNPRLQIQDPVIGAHTERHVVDRDTWACSGIGPYRIWALQLEGELAPSVNPNSADVGTGQNDASTDGETINKTSREDQLYNKLDHIHGPLKAFCHLADQALTDIQKALKDLSTPSPSKDAYSHLQPIELNLRTVSSGLSLLKDLSDISSLAPPPPPASPPKEPPSDQNLLSKILSRVHPPPPDPHQYPSTYPPWNKYAPPTNLEPYMPTLRALIVEDNLVNSKILNKFTQKLGVLPEYITSAFNGVEGLEAIEQMVQRGHFPDIILVDTAMPVMDGFEFLREFRKRYPGRRTRIVGMTAYYFKGDDRLEKLGANYVLSKPMKFDIVRREIETAARLKMTREIEFRGKL